MPFEFSDEDFKFQCQDGGVIQSKFTSQVVAFVGMVLGIVMMFGSSFLKDENRQVMVWGVGGILGMSSMIAFVITAKTYQDAKRSVDVRRKDGCTGVK